MPRRAFATPAQIFMLVRRARSAAAYRDHAAEHVCLPPRARGLIKVWVTQPVMMDGLDPIGRQANISVGCLLESLEHTATRQGFKSEIEVHTDISVARSHAGSADHRVLGATEIGRA